MEELVSRNSEFDKNKKVPPATPTKNKKTNNMTGVRA